VVIEALIEEFAGFREKRAYYETHPKLVWQIFEQGNNKAREVAQKTMAEVRRVMGLVFPGGHSGSGKS